MPNTKDSQETFVPRQCLPRTAQLLGTMIGESTITVAKYYLRELVSPITAGSVIHDNGCGTGAVTRAIFEAQPELFSPLSPQTIIHATDINPDMVHSFQTYINSRGWSETVQPATMAAENLISLTDSSVTHSFTNFVIFGARDPSKAAAEVYRTLVVGGVAIMTTWATLPHTTALDRTRAALYGEHGKPHIQPEWFHGTHLERLLRNTGFSRVSVSQVESEMEHDSLDAWTRLAWSWMGMPDGGWTEREEREWDKDRGLFGSACVEDGFEVRGSGKVAVKLIANVAIAWKDAGLQESRLPG